jgi:flavin reductase (DIM6/NTAB) family NADH-FMN oxidoreductase RutF
MIKHISPTELAHYERLYRARLINSLSGYKSANLIGTTDKNGNHNLTIVSSVFHLGADPALVGMIIRPQTPKHHSLDNLETTGWYTINQVNSDIIERAHQTSASYPKDESEFLAVGLTPEFSAPCPAPLVKESRLKFSVQLQSAQELAINGTHLIIGLIHDIFVDSAAVQEDGYIDIEALDSVAVTGLDSYHLGQRITRLSYAKPNLPLMRLNTDGTPSA